MTKYLIIGFTIFVAILSYTPHTESYIQTPVVVSLTMPEMIDKYSKKYNVLAHTMTVIIKCESKAYPKAINENINKKGVVWSRDYGPFQINDYFHKVPAEKMGLSIYDLEDNIEYGAYLLSKNGTQPWKASSYCWKPLLK